MYQTMLVSIRLRKLLAEPLNGQTLVSSLSNTDMFSGHENAQRQLEPCEGGSSSNANLALILAMLLCALICGIGLNSIARCALQCSSCRVLLQDWRAARIANTRLKRKALMSLPKLIYSSISTLPGFDPLCAICLSEFLEGEIVRVLPKCNHSFHINCIDPWFASHSSCPKCRHCLLNNNQKPTSRSQASQGSLPLPLEPEAFIINYRGTY